MKDEKKDKEKSKILIPTLIPSEYKGKFELNEEEANVSDKYVIHDITAPLPKKEGPIINESDIIDFGPGIV